MSVPVIQMIGREQTNLQHWLLYLEHGLVLPDQQSGVGRLRMEAEEVVYGEWGCR